MASRDELETVGRLLGEIPASAATCAAVAHALCETGQPLYSSGLFSLPTDHDRARSRMLRLCQSARATVARFRWSTLSAELIRAEAALTKIIACCESCPVHNAHRRTSGEPFECTVEGEPMVPPRFRLDEEGNIHERG